MCDCHTPLFKLSTYLLIFLPSLPLFSLQISIDLGCGSSSFTVLGSDLTHEYVSENADYRS